MGEGRGGRRDFLKEFDSVIPPLLFIPNFLRLSVINSFVHFA